MKTGPNLNRIHAVIETWSSGVIPSSEAFEQIARAMAPEYHVPLSELGPVRSTDPEIERMSKVIQRIEVRLSAITRHLNVPLPDELNPAVLMDDVRKLADQGRVLDASRVHRERNGSGLAEAKRAIDEYLGH